MLLAHAAAALLTAAVLAQRGAVLRRLVDLLEGLLPALPSSAALPVVELSRPAPPAHLPRLVGRLLATARRRRGPPAGVPLRPAAA